MYTLNNGNNRLKLTDSYPKRGKWKNHQEVGLKQHGERE
jgi:hypothetical protein